MTRKFLNVFCFVFITAEIIFFVDWFVTELAR
jgi:hypothetical protein